MAMILIEKDNATLKIPSGAYEKLYKPQGWFKCEDEEYAEDLAKEESTEDTEEEEDWDEEESKNILDDIRKMNTEQLKTFAANRNVDVSKCKSVGDLRSAISEALNV